ncbi:MAG: head-tail adaptor protein [Ruminococcus sp.]|nr:head-tail adaptor protein [Ruminococcus sp.]
MANSDNGTTKEILSLEFTVRQTPDTVRINPTTHKISFRGLTYNIDSILPNFRSLDYIKITAGTRKAGDCDDIY